MAQFSKRRQNSTTRGDSRQSPNCVRHCSTFGAQLSIPRLLPKKFADSTPKPAEKFKRITTSHEMNWIEAIKGKAEATSPFSYAARLTEVMLLGVVALNAGKKIQYDGANMKIPNAPQAEQFLKRQYRQGWSLS